MRIRGKRRDRFENRDRGVQMVGERHVERETDRQRDGERDSGRNRQSGRMDVCFVFVRGVMHVSMSLY